MKPKIVSLNVRDLNNEENRVSIRGLLRDWKASIVCLQETKMEVITREVVRSLWGCHLVDWSYLGTRGASRGILLL
jgi:exonuclease III